MILAAILMLAQTVSVHDVNVLPQRNRPWFTRHDIPKEKIPHDTVCVRAKDSLAEICFDGSEKNDTRYIWVERQEFQDKVNSIGVAYGFHFRNIEPR